MSAAQDDDTRDGVWEPRFAPVAQIIPPNVFADMDVKVAAAVASGADVIDLAKGNPDAYPAEFIRDVAKSSVDDPLNARYTPFDGKPAFLQAAANWYRNVHGVELDWRSQLFAVEGAVDGLAGLFAILIDRGDAVAFADPYYPSYHCMSVMHGAEEILLPARAELGWLPDLDAVDESVWRRLRMLILNYPNNPTGAQAPASFFEHAVELAKRYGFLIVHDFAYTGLGVSDQQVSLLTVPGASDVSVEVGSLSKMYAMAGWRAGFVAGNRDVVARLKQYHYQMGSMVTGMIQDAGAVALNSDQSNWPGGMPGGARSSPGDCARSDSTCSTPPAVSTCGSRRLRGGAGNVSPTRCLTWRRWPGCRARASAASARIGCGSAC